MDFINKFEIKQFVVVVSGEEAPSEESAVASSSWHSAFPLTPERADSSQGEALPVRDDTRGEATPDVNTGFSLQLHPNHDTVSRGCTVHETSCVNSCSCTIEIQIHPQKLEPQFVQYRERPFDLHSSLHSMKGGNFLQETRLQNSTTSPGQLQFASRAATLCSFPVHFTSRRHFSSQERIMSP